MMDYNGHDLGPAAVKRNDDLEGGIRAVLQPGQTMFWDATQSIAELTDRSRSA